MQHGKESRPSSVAGGRAGDALRAPPTRAPGRLRAWGERSVDFTVPSDPGSISSVYQDGLWWEWQTRGPGGWTSLEASVSERLEEAYTLGESVCRFWKDGSLMEFDLRGALEALGSSRLRRVRMPQPEETAANSASTCSTCWVPNASSHDIDPQESSMAVSSTRWADADDPRFYLVDASQDVLASPSKDTMPSMLLPSVMESSDFSQWLQS